MADEATGEVDLRDYAMVLMDLPAAQLEATLKLNEVIRAVQDTGKAGTLTVTFNITTGKLDNTTIEILPVVKAGVPRQPLRGAVFYPDKNHNPTKDDPSQLWRGDNIRDAPTFHDVTTDTTIKEAPTA